MPEITSGRLLRRHVAPFVIPLVLTTGLLLARTGAQIMPQLQGRENVPAALLEVLVLALPFTLALTIPMAVFIAVCWVFTRLGREGVLQEARRDRAAFRRLAGPVLGAAALIALLTLVLNAQLLPRANGRFTAVLTQHPVRPTDRSMTLTELREAARRARATAGHDAPARAAAYEVEIQKKLALAAASLVLALAAAAIPLRFPGGGPGRVIGASTAVFVGYYIALLAGEALADQRLISPFAGMWLANALLLGLALLLTWPPGGAWGRRRAVPLGG